jgi:uncharacterized repeat protein (TIGR01451 family)
MRVWHKIFVVVVVTLVTSAVLVTTVAATPLTQDPRPPDTSEDGDGGGREETGKDSNGSNGGLSSVTCAGLDGQVLTWGIGGTGGVGVTLRTGSWQVIATSASDGTYSFGGLGTGLAVLHVDVPPEQNLKPLIQDAGVYLNCDYPLVANIAVHGGDSISPPPPVMLEMSSSPQVTPGEEIVIQLQVKNTLPTAISQVTVTSLMPPALTPVQVAAVSESAATEIVGGAEDGLLVFVYLNNVPAGGEENIFVTATVSENVPIDSQIQTTATLFYPESVAVQDGFTFAVGDGIGLMVATPEAAAQVAEQVTAVPAEPMTTAPTPSAGATKAPAPAEETDTGEEFVPPGGLPTTGDSFLPPPGLLPETGQNLTLPDLLPQTGLGLLIPFGGLGLGCLAFVLHHLRKTRNS